ncbi:MAG TPA: hypothetical protein PLV58_10760, partial [Campylobacterales bacterium]|nr:hypothetical protein [Campylobacterales bacterium]
MRNISVRGKLIIIAVATILILILSAVMVNDIIKNIKINGELYNKINLQNELIADILPPPAYLIESYLTALKALDASQDKNTLISKIQNLESQFNERKQYYEKILSNSDKSKDILLNESFESGKRFYSIINSEWVFAVKDENIAKISSVV